MGALIKLNLEPFDIGLADFSLDLGAFDIGEGKNDNRYCLPRPPKRPAAQAVKYDRAADLIADCGQAILDGERVDALLSGNFIFGEVFEALAVEKLVGIKDLTLSTLSIGQENVDSFANMMKHGFLKNLNIIVSDYFWSHNRHNAAYIYEALDIDDRFQLAVAGTHTKVALLAIQERKIVCHGSANLRSSRSVETMTIETNPDLYDFHMEWHQDILTNYATIRKPLRAQKLFDHLTRKKS
jgi:hypothetical protein